MQSIVAKSQVASCTKSPGALQLDLDLHVLASTCNFMYYIDQRMHVLETVGAARSLAKDLVDLANDL